MTLAVGHYDDGAEKPPVFAFVCGEENNRIGYAYRPQGLSNLVRLSCHKLRSISFEEPFCDLGNGTQTPRGVIDRLKAVMLYYFLAAGHISHIQQSSSFWLNFQRACASIAKGGAGPHLAAALPTEEAENTTPGSTPSMPLLGKYLLQDTSWTSY